MVVEAFVAGAGDEVKTVAGSDAAGAAFALVEVGLAGPDCGVVGHVVAGGEYLLLDLAAVDYVDDVVDSDAGLGDVCGDDDFGFAWRWFFEDLGEISRRFLVILKNSFNYMYSGLFNYQYRLRIVAIATIINV